MAKSKKMGSPATRPSRLSNNFFLIWKASNEDFNHADTLELTSTEVDENETTRQEMEEEDQKDTLLLEKMVVDFLGGYDSEIEYGTPTSPTSSEVDEAERVARMMAIEAATINWDDTATQE